MKFYFASFIIASLYLNAQAPANYYSGTEGLSGYALKSKLYEIISKKTINWHYGDLPDYYAQTDLDKYDDHDATNTTILMDIYSERIGQADAYEYTVNDIIGSANAEGLGWNREHMMPQSTFYSNYPMYSDLFFVVPTDARINQLRSNYPYGVGSTIPSEIYHSFTNTSKIAKNATPNSPYTGRVYEPIDAFKGDVARSLLYFIVRYEGKLGTFKYNTTTLPSTDVNPLNGTEEKGYDDWFINMLIQWHNLDPVSQKEIDRNNAVYAIQKNRNPFIDNPSWVNAIWGQTPSVTPPTAPTQLNTTQVSAYFVNLTWTPSSNADVIGYKIYANGTEVGYSNTNTFTVDHLDPNTTYTFTVAAYDNTYSLSPLSTPVTVTTLANDVYAKDIFVSKYLEGTSNNKAIELLNKTGHPVNLTHYKLFIQYPSGGNYYFPAPFELEGIMQPNEKVVIMNPSANFSCLSVQDAQLVTAAPQLTFTGSQYLEIRYKDTPVDAIGIKNQSNSSLLQNVSLYRNHWVQHPTVNFDSNEWTTYASNYCNGLGTLTVSDHTDLYSQGSIYPNPVTHGILNYKGKEASKIKSATIYDLSGRVVKQVVRPFEKGNSLNISDLAAGQYFLKLDGKTFNFTKL